MVLIEIIMDSGSQITLAEIILSVGGKLAVILSSSLTSVGALWGIYKISGLGVKVLKNVPYWFEVQKNDDSNCKQYITRDQIIQSLVVYSKIGFMIFIGVIIRILGSYMHAPGTVNKLNTLVYGSK